MPPTPSDHQTTHIISTLGLSISAVCAMGMHVGVQAEPPMVVTSLKTSATAEGTGSNDDGLVDGCDLTELIGAWGACVEGATCASDLNQDGIVDGEDLTRLLSNWGVCS
jgi:hypothetical protein